MQRKLTQGVSKTNGKPERRLTVSIKSAALDLRGIADRRRGARLGAAHEI